MTHTEILIVLIIASVIALGVGGYFGVRACEAAKGADWGKPWLNRLDGLNRIFCRRYHRLVNEPLNLPASGPALVASNHISGLDPLLLIAAAARPLRFLIAREEYDRWWLRWLFRAVGCIPVERSRNPRRALEAARKALERGEVVALFPHGRIHLDHHDAVPLKRGVVLLSALTGAPIHPVRIEGVRAQGLTIAAVVIPSRALLLSFAPLHCDMADEDSCLESLWDKLALPETQRLDQNPHRQNQRAKSTQGNDIA